MLLACSERLALDLREGEGPNTAELVPVGVIYTGLLYPISGSSLAAWDDASVVS